VNTTTSAGLPADGDAALDRCIAALLEPEHERAQFEVLWARIAAEDWERPTPQPVARRSMSSLTALAATLLIGAVIAWYQRASAPNYTTLADSPRHACRPAPMQVDVAAPPTRAAGEARLDGTDVQVRASVRPNALCTPEVR